MHFPDRENMEFRHHHRGHFGRHLAGGILFGAALITLLGYVVMQLWNTIVPALIAGQHIRFGQAVGLLILARILVGGFHRGHGWGHRGFRGRHFGPFAARQEYEDWWREVGRQSFADYSSGRQAAKPNES